MLKIEFDAIEGQKKEYATAQKQEYGCHSLQPSIRNRTHATIADPPVDNKLLINN